jgi:hypothetical protein
MRSGRCNLWYAFAGLLLAVPALASAKPNPFLGTWVLNVAKSKYTGAPAPKSSTAVYSAAGGGIHVVATGTNAAGAPTRVEYTANFDGKDYAVTGSPDYDMVSLKRVFSNKITFTRKRGGTVVQTGSMTVSKDGRTRTVITDGTNAAGQKIHSVGVYERK